MSNSYTDVFSGKMITPAFPQYSRIDLKSNIELAWPAQFQNTLPVIAITMVIIPDTSGYTIRVPNAMEGSTGFRFTIKNESAFSFDVFTNDGSPLAIVEASQVWEFWLDDNSTTAGEWTIIPYIQGTSAITFINATSSSNNLVIGGVPITTAGTITFALQKDLFSLTSFGLNQGIAVRNNENNWLLRSITSNPNHIVITNGNGVADNPNISLAPAITGITSIRVGNFLLSGNTIASTNNDGDVIVDPHGTGVLRIESNAELRSSHTLKFYAPNNLNFIEFGCGVTVNQSYIWPTTAPADGQVMSYTGGGFLGWATVPTSAGGPTTVDAIARYANAGGALKNSNVVISDTWDLTGLVSAVIGNVKIGNPTSQTITTTGPGDDLILAPNGAGAVSVTADLAVSTTAGTQKKLRLHSAGPLSFYAALKADPAMVANVTWKLPAADAAGVFRSDNAGNITISPVYSGGASTVTALARFSDIAGTIQNSTVLLDNGGNLTGITSAAIGNISLSANTITTGANQPLTIQPNGTGSLTLSTTTTGDLTLSGGTAGNIISSGDFQIRPVGGARKKLRLYDDTGNRFAALQSVAALLADVTFTLPSAASAGVILSDGAGVMFINSLGASAGILRTDGVGEITVNTVVSTANAVAKYSDTVGTFAASPTVFIDGNNNLSVGTSSVATTATSTITLAEGTAATAVGAGSNILSIGNRNTGGGNVLALFGDGDGGVSASVVNTTTHKISIYVNGTRYYLLANTNPL